MKSGKLNNLLLASMLMVCCCQQISAGLVVKTAKIKNSTNSTKGTMHTTKHPKIAYKGKTTTTTKKPEVETTTLLPLDLDYDGRSAFINNRFVADPEDPVQDTASPLYELLQQQMENVVSNRGGGKMETKEAVNEEERDKLKPPQTPLFAYEVGQFDDYEEEDTSDYGTDGEYIPDNCEDTQESLVDNDDTNTTNNKDNTSPVIINNQQNLPDNYGPTSLASSQPATSSGQLVQNKLYESSNYDPQKQQQVLSSSSSSYNTAHTSYGHKKPQANSSNQSKPTRKTQNSKIKPYSNQNSYGQTNHNVQTSAANYVQVKPSENYSQDNQNKQASYNILQQHSKTKPAATILIEKTTNFANISTNPYLIFNPSISSFSAVNPSLNSNYLYGDSNTEETSSPFSSTSASGQKSHLTFRTVASSTQYVSSPLADLMFKFSIGMAKPANSQTNSINSYGGNQPQIFNVYNDMETKTDTN